MFNKHKHMPTCDMLKNSQYVQNQKIGTSNPITLSGNCRNNTSFIRH